MSQPHLRPYYPVLDTIGGAPLIRPRRPGAGGRAPGEGEAGEANPRGAGEDRSGRAVIRGAQREGGGTGGTTGGAGKYLKEKTPAVRVIAGDPVGSLYTQFHRTRTLGEGHPYKVEGIGGDKIPTTIWFDWIDEFRQVSDKTSLTMARRVAREEGVLAGGAAGRHGVVGGAVAPGGAR